MDALILGAAGQLGGALQATVPATFAVHAFTSSEIDITNKTAVADCLKTLRPRLIINAAAYTAVDKAETESVRAHQVNAEALQYLVQGARENDSRVIHVSTDFVFDGAQGVPYRPSDRPNPLSVYGKTKLEGERILLDGLGPRALVIRAAWVYSSHGTNFLLTMLRLMRERSEVRVVSDQISTPTSVTGLARLIWLAATRPERSGLYHWTDAGVASWYDFAVAIQDEALKRGLLTKAIPIVPIRTDEYPTAARRPPYSVLDKSATWKDFGIVAKHWTAELRGVMQELTS